MTDFTRRSALAAAAAMAAAPLLPSVRAQAAAPPVGKQVPGYYRYKVGELEVTSVTDGGRATPVAENLVRNASKTEVGAALQSFFMAPDQFINRFNPVVVNTGSKLVVIDTGLGAGAFSQSKGAVGQFHANLAASGIDTKSVDAVVISHFHGDHISGLVDAEGKPAFANAEVLVPAAEWAFWMDDGNMNRASDAAKPGFQNVRRVFGALAGKVTQFEPNKEIVPGITTIATPGHTAGHSSFRVASGNNTLIVQADVTAGPAWLFIRNPGWHVSFDADGPLAEQSRRKLYDQAATDRTLVQVFHNPFPGVGYIEKTGNGYRFEPLSWNPNI
jgi:glyoxylase-like metal-dependent hydrolase (beta-lactamase superfamily II)